MLWLFLCFLLLNNPVLADFESTPSATVIINKFQYSPPSTTNSEWVELYNTTDQEIDLNDWSLVDNNKHQKPLTNRKISAKGFLTFVDGNNWLNNTTNNDDGDIIFLINLKTGETVDQVDYKRFGGEILVKGQVVSTEDLKLEGKWIGRSDVGSSTWQIFTDSDGPIGGGINYFNGYKTVVENIGITIIPATDQSGIGVTTIITKVADLLNNDCINFVVDVGNSLSDGKCYKFEYMAPDGVGNSSVFTSNSIVKFDTTKPILNFDNAFRNILKLKSVFGGVDPESGILKYKYGTSNLNCGSTIVPTDWSYIYNSILDVGYTGQPSALYGKSINNALIESDMNCVDFAIDVIAPKIINQINPEKGEYKVGDKLPLSVEFGEAIELVNSNLFKVDKFDFVNKLDNILNFEYEVKSNDLTNNLVIGETKINVNGGQINDVAGNGADLTINNFDNGIKIDGVIPMISLIGESYVEISQFGNYLDLGATASDVPDGDLTNKIIIENMVDTNLGGIYENKYLVTDSAGNNNEIKRKVKVVDTIAPTLKTIINLENFQFSINSNEEGYVEWMGKCEGEENNLIVGDNLIKIKNSGDGIYDDCEIRAWDKWGNVGEWQTIESFVVDTTPPVISFINSSQTEIAIMSNENLKSCQMEKENIISGDFETGNIDGWTGYWIVDNLHFAKGSWSARSPNLVNDDLAEKSIEQKINMEGGGVLSFWWRVSSEKDWDYLKFYMDGVLMNKISGEVSWQELKYNLNTGEHIIKFTYSKDYSGESKEDAGWIDEVKIEGGGSIIPMNVVDNNASVKLNNLSGGSNKYKVSCTDMDDNKSETIEKEIIKNIEKVNEDNIPTPTPYTIFKTSAIIPTIKLAKPTSVKTPTKIPVKKMPAVLGVAITTPNVVISSPPTTKLKSSTPWEEIKFWAMGMLALGTTSGVVLLDKKIV